MNKIKCFLVDERHLRASLIHNTRHEALAVNLVMLICSCIQSSCNRFVVLTWSP